MGCTAKCLVRSEAAHQTLTLLSDQENRHKAIFRKGDGNITAISHHYLTIRAIKFDGMRTGGGNGGIRIGHDSARGIHHVVFEDNIVEKMGRSCIHLTQGQHDITIRHNLVDGCGYAEYWGEGFYLGGKHEPDDEVSNIEIYGNIARDATDNMVNVKRYGKGIAIHHNIFEDQVQAVDRGIASDGNDGAVSIGGNTNEFRDNIVRNNKGGMAMLLVGRRSKIIAEITFSTFNCPDKSCVPRVMVGGRRHQRGWRASRVSSNTFCNLVSYEVSDVDPGIVFENNRMNAPQSACDVEVTRIMNELRDLPGYPQRNRHARSGPAQHA